MIKIVYTTPRKISRKFVWLTWTHLTQLNQLFLSAPNPSLNNIVPIEKYFATKVCQYVILIYLTH